MRTKPKPDGTTDIGLDKGEARRLLEASYILDHIGRLQKSFQNERGTVVPQEVARWVREAARHYGAEHLDEKGLLKESPRQKAVTE